MFRNLTLLNDIKLDATHIISNLIVLNDIKVDITSIFWKLALLNDIASICRILIVLMNRINCI